MAVKDKLIQSLALYWLTDSLTVIVEKPDTVLYDWY